MAHLYTLTGVCTLPRAFLSAQGLPRASKLAATPHRETDSFPAAACASYPFVYLCKANTLLCKLFTFRKSEIFYPGGDTIAICHCSIKIVSRGKGKSAVAAAAYRTGEKLTNEWDRLTHDYTGKGGDPRPGGEMVRQL